MSGHPPQYNHGPYGSTDGYGPVVPPPASTVEPGVAGYVVALIAGIPVAALMGMFVVDSILNGQVPGTITTIIGGTSTLGSVLAVAGVRSRPRRFRTTALVLTLLPAFGVAVAFGLFILMLFMFILGSK